MSTVYWAFIPKDLKIPELNEKAIIGKEYSYNINQLLPRRFGPHGYHRLVDALHHSKGHVLMKLELSGKNLTHDDFTVAERMKIISLADCSLLMHTFGVHFARLASQLADLENEKIIIETINAKANYLNGDMGLIDLTGTFQSTLTIGAATNMKDYERAAHNAANHSANPDAWQCAYWVAVSHMFTYAYLQQVNNPKDYAFTDTDKEAVKKVQNEWLEEKIGEAMGVK